MKYEDLNKIKNCIINSICPTCEGIIKLEDENEKLKTKIKSLTVKIKAKALKLQK